MTSSIKDFMCEVDIEIMEGLLDQCVHNLEKKLSQQNNSQEYQIHEQKCITVQKYNQASQERVLQGSQKLIRIHSSILKPSSEQMSQDSEQQKSSKKVHFSHQKMDDKKHHIHQNQKNSIEKKSHLSIGVYKQLINDMDSVPVNLNENCFSSPSKISQFKDNNIFYHYNPNYLKVDHRTKLDQVELIQKEYQAFYNNEKKQQQKRSRIYSVDQIYNQQDQQYYDKMS